LDAGPDLTVEPDAVTGTGSTDVTLTLGSYPASDVTVDNANCTFKTGTTWTCRNLVAGDTVVTFSVTYAGERGWRLRAQVGIVIFLH
jgi:hypothetical protein